MMCATHFNIAFIVEATASMNKVTQLTDGQMAVARQHLAESHSKAAATRATATKKAKATIAAANAFVTDTKLKAAESANKVRSGRIKI